MQKRTQKRRKDCRLKKVFDRELISLVQYSDKKDAKKMQKRTQKRRKDCGLKKVFDREIISLVQYTLMQDRDSCASGQKNPTKFQVF